MKPGDIHRDLAIGPKTDPASIYRYRDGIFAADLLTTAILELDFFTRFGDASLKKEEIATLFNCHPRPLDVLLSLCLYHGYLERTNGEFKLTTLAKEHLIKGSTFYIGGYFASLSERPVVQGMLKVFQTGKPANWGGYEEEDWHDAMEDKEFAEQFTAAMDARGPCLGHALASRVNLGNRTRFLDIGGGSGIYACCLAASHPGLTGDVVEKAPVNEIARRKIRERGFSNRIGVITADMFEDSFPEGYDIHLLSNVLHDWDFPEIHRIVAASAKSLKKGSLLIAHEAFLNDDKDGPLPVIEYSAILMHATQGRCYSLTDLEPIFKEHGFQFIERFDTAADRSALIFERS